MRALQVALGLTLLGVLGARVAGVTRGGGRPPAPAAPSDLGAAPEFRLTDQDARVVTRQDLDGRPWVAAFIFTRCRGVCPMMTARMKGLSEKLPGLRFVSFSVDPQDGPKDLKRFAAAYGAGWTFLGGRGDEVKRLSREGFKLAAENGGTKAEPIVHSDRLVLVDPRSRIRGYFTPGASGEDERLAAAVSGL